MFNTFVKLFKPKLKEWLFDRVLYIPEKDVEKLAVKFKVPAKLVRELNLAIADQAVKNI